MLVTRRKRQGNYGRHLECFCSSNCSRRHLLMPRAGCLLLAAPVHKSRGDMWRALAGCPFAAWLVTCWHLRPDTWHFVSALFLCPLCGLSVCHMSVCLWPLPLLVVWFEPTENMRTHHWVGHVYNANPSRLVTSSALWRWQGFIGFRMQIRGQLQRKMINYKRWFCSTECRANF